MMQSDVQTEGARPSVFILVARVAAAIGFACAGAIIAMLALGVLGTWGVYLGFVAANLSAAGFFALAPLRANVRVLQLLVPIVCMMVGVLGMLVSGWTLLLHFQH
ncbi:MAG: hypothetical protein L0H73_09090 [Nitrococcus sp.]|nr:hypothetical protein [Nitrococcus sp.]